jgi:two-component system nitrogen regulation sensor histidine kinase NtrY
LAEAVVFKNENGQNKIISGSRLSFLLDPLSKINYSTLQNAANGDVALFSDDTEDKVSAVIGLKTSDNIYLMVSRFVDPKVIEHTKQAKGAADEYLKLKVQIANFQIKSTILFVFIAVFLLLASIWMAFKFAGNMVNPIINLVSATDRVKKGEFTVRVKEGPENDEIGILTRSFNQMAAELDDQKHGLMRANLESKERAAFTETVLSGVSSGVMALDIDKKIVTVNRAALELLGINKGSIGKPIKDIVPEFDEAMQNMQEGQIALRRKQKRLNFMLRITPQMARKTIEGYILTFDDLTELLSAQRSAAWSDVARRIAHEIKNPLTPINLSAQRIAKKFKPYVPEDELENFEGYTNTITRHTADIAKIIGEFSDFAKMPAPKFAKCNISLLLKDAIFSARVSFPSINFELDMPDAMETIADPSQITQVLTNVIKNASESIIEKGVKNGRIMAIAQMNKSIEIYLDDNGGGFPEELLDRITEPYVTTRSKGTGLGLAIVKKIMEDHNGKLELTNIAGGARVKITLPIV